MTVILAINCMSNWDAAATIKVDFFCEILKIISPPTIFILYIVLIVNQKDSKYNVKEVSL